MNIRENTRSATLTVNTDQIETSSGCVSDVSQSIVTEEMFEVTREQHLALTASKFAPNRSSKRLNCDSNFGKSRFPQILGSRAFRRNSDEFKPSRNASLHNGNDENCDGSQSFISATNHTVRSFETIKVSNASKLDHCGRYDSVKKNEGSRNRWNPLKRIIRIKATPSRHDYSSDVFKFRVESALTVDRAPVNRTRAQTEDSGYSFQLDRRIQSTPGKSFLRNDRLKDDNYCNRADQNELDDNIRRRFYGVNVQFLGDGRFTTTGATSAAPWDSPFLYSFTGQSPHWSPQQIVNEMLLSSSGRESPEILLDGVTPGPDGRWSVQVTVPRQTLLVKERDSSNTEKNIQNNGRPFSHSSTTCNSQDIHHPEISSSQLQSIIWGSEIPPLTDCGNLQGEDNIHSLAARLSIPIDIDDESFLITRREHIQALHEIISLNLSHGRFEDSCQIFNLLFRGISTIKDPDLRFFKGAALHNLGVIQLWQVSQRRNAATTFHKAIRERQKSLPPKHPDIIASLVQKATANFAAGDLKGAISDLECALNMTSPDHFLRATVLNNLGVAYYFHRGGKSALKEFITSLEIQRRWLESTIWRETPVYDAAITLCNMGKVYFELSEFDLSLRAYEEALLMLTSIFSKDHDMVLACLSSLAVAKGQKGDISHALQILHGCLRSQTYRFGEMSPASIETIGLIGFLNAKIGEYNTAIKHLTTVRKWQKINLSAQHPSLLKTKECIKTLESRLGIVRSPSVAKVWV